MTLHQLTQAAGLDADFGLAHLARRLVLPVAALSRRWHEARQAEQELARLDHRERADLACRR